MHDALHFARDVIDKPMLNETSDALTQAIEKALPGAKVQVKNPSGGHFEIAVVHASFAGKTLLAKQRLVYSAIAPLMKGDAPPVHAIDKMDLQAS